MKRTPTWQADLAELIRSRHDQPFEWGAHDCCLFAADAVQAITGTDLAFSRGYSARDALRMIDEHGGLRKLVSQLLGPEMPVCLAQVGDVLLVESDSRELLAICNGATALAPGRGRLVTLPTSAWLAAWRVGDV